MNKITIELEINEEPKISFCISSGSLIPYLTDDAIGFNMEGESTSIVKLLEEEIEGYKGICGNPNIRDIDLEEMDSEWMKKVVSILTNLSELIDAQKAKVSK